MRKATTNGKIERRGLRILGVASLALTFAAFGCTTTRYGEPTSVSPSNGPTNHGVMPGSSSGAEGNTPMASSSTGVSSVDTDALATLAAEQGFRSRDLGPVNPGGVQTGVPIQPTGGQFVSPAMVANPQSTVNSSISSDPTPVISSGTTAAGVTIAAAGTTQTAETAATGMTMGNTAITTAAGSAVSSPMLMNSTPPPQATGTASAATGRGLAATSKATTAKSTTASAKTARRSTSKTTKVAKTSGVSSIRIETGTQGQLTVTNSSATSTKAGSAKP